MTKKTKQNSEVPITEISGLYLRILLLSMFFPVIGITNAQSPEWVMAKAMGGSENESGHSITLDASGNIYTTGYFQGTVDFDPGAGTFDLTSDGEADIFISKLNGSGSFEWALSMGGTDEDFGYSIALDASGNVYTTGNFQGTADFNPGAGVFNLTSVADWDIFISKLDNSGNFVWAKAISGTNTDQSNTIALDASGNVYTTGWFGNTTDFDPGAGVFNLTSAGDNDIFISKLDNAGNFVWAKAMGGTGADDGNSIALDASGNVYTTGDFSSTADFDPGAGVFNLTSAGGTDIFISKLDNTGNFVWAKAMGGTGGDYGNEIDLDASGNVYTTGYFNNTADFDPGAGVFNLTSAGNHDIFISKLDNTGNFVWAKAMGGTDVDHSNSIAVDASGNVYTTGFFKITADFDPGTGIFNLISFGTSDIFISKLDESGNFVFALNAGGTAGESGNSIALDASGNSFLTGSFVSPSISFGSISLTNAGVSDIYIAKVGVGSGTDLSVSITSSTNVLCNGQNTGSATAAATGGDPPYTYNWSNGGTGATINNLAAGTYTVTVTDNNDATATASVTITQPSLLILSPPTITNVSCNGGDNGSIQAGATGGVSPYTFNWSEGSTGATISNLTAGSYTVTVTDDNDCTKTATYTVTQPEDITISLVDLNHETCEGEEDGSITISVMGGVNPIFAEWSNGSFGTSITDLPPGIYSVTVTDFNDCTKTETYAINPGGFVVVTLNQIQHVSCAGGSNGSISVTASGGVEPYTFIWSNGATDSSITNLTAGSYVVTVTDSHGCQNVEEYTINQPTAIVIEIIQPTQNLCFGDSTADLTSNVTGGVAPYTELWSNGTIGFDNSNLHAGAYTVTVTDDNDCTSMMSATVIDPPQLTVAVSTTDETAVGANNGTATATAGGGTPVYSYLWSNSGTTATITGLAPGTYTVTITDMNGCTVIGSGQVFAFGCTLDVMLGVDQLICDGDTSIITPIVIGASGSVTYVWTDGSTGESLPVDQGGEYCVTVIDAAGCQDADCIVITEIIIPPLTCPVTNESAPGANDGAIQCDSLTDIVAYLWSNGATTSSITGLSPGQYCVTVTDNNSCTKSQCFYVQPGNCQMMVTAAQTDVGCYGDSTGSITLMVTGATEPVTYAWSNSETSPTINNLAAGSYFVTVADAAGCVENQSFIIIEPPPITITVDSIAPVSDFPSGLIWITVSGGIPPYIYYWLDPSGGSLNTEDLNGLFVYGNYSVTVTDAAGCAATLDSIFVDQDVAVDPTPQFKSLKVYPVPTDDVLFIDMENPITEVLISGVDGRLYKRIINPLFNQLDVSDLGLGWYIIRISDGHSWYNARMVK